MPRRRRRRNNSAPMSMLTGGTRDVKPQYLTFSITESAADTTTTVTQALPVLRNFTSTGGRAQVIEVLKVYISFGAQSEVDSVMQLCLTTKSFGTTVVSASDPNVFAYVVVRSGITTSGTFQQVYPVIIDLTDGAGNGLLIATDNIYAQIFSTGTSAAIGANVKLLYRISGASLTEYVGIVQSQQ